MGRRLANIDIEHPKTLNQFRADQRLTRQRPVNWGRFQLKAIGHFLWQAGP